MYILQVTFHTGVTVRQKTIGSIAGRFCGKSDSLTLDEFILCALKVMQTTGRFIIPIPPPPPQFKQLFLTFPYRVFYCVYHVNHVFICVFLEAYRRRGGKAEGDSKVEVSLDQVQ